MLVQAFKNTTLVYEGRIRDTGNTLDILATIREFLREHEISHNLITLHGGPSRRCETYALAPDEGFKQVTFTFGSLHQRIIVSKRRSIPYQIPMGVTS
jgi:hypothetical protein